MSLRPVPARWFEMVCAREDLPLAVETLARNGSVELEIHADTDTRLDLQGLQEGMREFSRLARRYQPYWPAAERRANRHALDPTKILDVALQRLRAWERAAAPVIRGVEARLAEQEELRHFGELVVALGEGSPDFALLAAAGPVLQARVFVLPSEIRLAPLPAAMVHAYVRGAAHDFLLAVGLPDALDVLAGALAEHKARVLRLHAPLPETPAAVIAQVRRRRAQLDREIERLREQITALSQSHYLAITLGELQRLEWFMRHVGSVPVSVNFARVTGWTDDRGGDALADSLRAARVDAMMHFPRPPQKLTAPMVLQNPWWARPFEGFTRLLGTPATAEADPSALLALLVPLLFGYMFGDVGHGLVLLAAGVALRRRWPLLRLLVPCGLSAMFFGLVFGSVFGQEGWLAPLWLNPLREPLPVLLVPLAGGVVVLMLGLVLNAMQAAWRGEVREWLSVEAAVLVMYAALVASVFAPAARYVMPGAAVWFFAGRLAGAGGRPFWSSLAAAAGALIEAILQLLLNTVSFVRVGAFALAHVGLSLAFTILAAATDSLMLAAFILLLGNLIVIMLEGLVVSVQTTRLILFEFFIRFLRGTGRRLRPLSAPGPALATRRTT
jgi:V/A-type H+-transporting ATPase subunit I